MTTLEEIGLNLSDLDKAVITGYVSVRPHPDNVNLLIYNYTPKAQYERVWTTETLTCRGLILNIPENEVDVTVVARPFKKFFNLGEAEMPEGPFVAQEKMDGSLGIIYLAPDGLPSVATRGSFASDQAIWATKKLRSNEKLVKLAKEIIADDFTVLVEIIYPENRIVLDYGDREVLVGLTAIHNRTGLDTDLEELGWPEPIAPFCADFSMEILERQDDTTANREGVVLRWADGTRLKVKFEEYVRLHKIVTRVTERSIWEMLSNGHPIASLAEYVPDEFYEWMNTVATGLIEEFSAVEKEALASLSSVDRAASRKDQASLILEGPHCGIVFKMLDGKAYKDQIWAQIKPSAERSFEEV